MLGHDYEWVVINGGEFDEEEQVKEIGYPKTKYIKGPDAGRYEGMNKGLKAASGEYIIFMNAGDMLSQVPANIFLGSGIGLKMILGKQLNLVNSKQSNPFLAKAFLKFGVRPIPHQASIFKREGLISIGGYKESYGINADQELIWRYVSKFGIMSRNTIISIFQGGGIGDDISPSQFHNDTIKFTGTRKHIISKLVLFLRSRSL
jgi:glycosyltransferase involved in cell wall biosynthesis